MRAAAVGQQCVECVRADAKTVQQPRGQHSGRPVVTQVLIAANVLAFIVQNVSANLQNALVLWAPAVAYGQLYRLVTSAFLHYGLTHLLFNMWALYVIGPALESHLGRVRFSVLYGLSALGGSVAVYLISPLDTVTAGASGAIFGLFAAAGVVAKRLDLDMRWIVGLIAINLLITFVVPHISWQGHIGGLISGAVITAAYVYAPRWVPSEHRNLVQAGASAAVLVLLSMLIWWRSTELLTMFSAG